MTAKEDPIRVIVLLMIKNESRIITRSINSTLSFADAICIEDTGSTDNTIEVIENHFKTITIPCKLSQHPWKNFGYSRSHSRETAKEFCKELGWNLQRTYVFVMDADMNLVFPKPFDKNILKDSGYQVLQKNTSVEYVNIRFMRLSDDWKCVGATHEYWEPPPNSNVPNMDQSHIFIDDKNDGGCKSDKFTRDATLLEQELAEQPNNYRTVFYLAQTYKCLGEHEKAIKMYKRRIKMGGWFEEVWYSMYAIVTVYLQMNKPEKAELWANRAYSYNSFRAEALYHIIRHYRITPGNHYKAYHYYLQAKKIKKPDVALFIENNVYDVLLDYENTILQYYVSSNKHDGNMSCINYGMKYNAIFIDNVVENLEFYCVPLNRTHSSKPLDLPKYGYYTASSPSVIQLDDKTTLMNIRYVNYETTRDGRYFSREKDGQVRTLNAYMKYERPFDKFDTMTFIQQIGHPTDLTPFPTNIEGFEDVRLFSFKNKIYYTSSCKHYSPEYRIVMGEYDMSSNTFLNNKVLQPPGPTPCEKNWLALTHLPEIHFIYSWYPLMIGKINQETNCLEITKQRKMPAYFQKVRGSSNPIEINNQLYCLTHVVKYGSPRKYFHNIVVFDKQSLEPIMISEAFCFQEIGIEYCLSMNYTDNNKLEFVYSHFDSRPTVITVPMNAFEFVKIPLV